jgi:hypothetical protein
MAKRVAVPGRPGDPAWGVACILVGCWLTNYVVGWLVIAVGARLLSRRS